MQTILVVLLIFALADPVEIIWKKGYLVSISMKKFRLIPGVFKEEIIGKRQPILIQMNDRGKAQTIYRYYLFQMGYSWLIFSVYMQLEREDDKVINIYPKKYDYKKDPYWNVKYNDLCSTGYFG